MILDGYWRIELHRYERRLKIWGRLCNGKSTYEEHQVNKYLLYSAAAIRKLIEDEADAKEQIEKASLSMPELALLHYDMPAVEYRFDGDKNDIIHKVIVDNYKTAGKTITIEAKTICNSIIHSYIWNLAYGSKNKGIIGFFTASDFDKEKKLYLIKLSDWISYLAFCRENCTV